MMVARHEGPFFASDGKVSYTCGNCGLVLLSKMHANQVQDMLLQCGRCQAVNRTGNPKEH